MKMSLRRFFSRLRSIPKNERAEQELNDEIRTHLDMEEAEQREAGLTPGQARDAARRAFGNVRRTKEESRDTWIFSQLDEFTQNIRYGLRQMQRSPGFTIVAIATLALGIGANTAIFSLLEPVVLRRLSVPHAEQLVLLRWTAQKLPKWSGYTAFNVCDKRLDMFVASGCSFSYPVLDQLRQHSETALGISGYAGPTDFRLALNGGATQVTVSTAIVTGDFFATMQMSPFLGRSFGSSDDVIGAPPVAMISYGFWDRQFGRDPAILGKSITLQHLSFTIVGVGSREFFGLDPTAPTDCWIPVHAGSQFPPHSGVWNKPDSPNPWMSVIARLKPGVRPAQASAELGQIFRQAMVNDAANPFPTDANPAISLPDASRGFSDLRSKFSDPLTALMVIVSLVLLIACANIANLLLARASARRTEIAVRMAIGAGRGRLVRQLITENLLMAITGAIAGFLLAMWASHALAAFILTVMWGNVKFDIGPRPIVFLFAAAVAIFSVLLFGVAPSLRATRVDPSMAIKSSGGVAGGASGMGAGRRNFGRVLVAGQIAVALVLLIGAGLFLRTLINLETMDPGFRPDHILTFGLSARIADYPAGKLESFNSDLQQRLLGLPGVRSVSWSNFPLLASALMTSSITSKDKPELGTVQVLEMDIGTAYFETMQIPLLQGRSIQRNDVVPKPNVVWINHSLANLFFGGEDPIGKILSAGTIEGVVGDAKYQGLRDEIRPTIYRPYPYNGGNFFVRTDGDPRPFEAVLRQTIKEVSPSLSPMNLKTEEEIIEQNLFNERLMARLSVAFGFLALALTSVGVYGVLAYSVARRTSEIAVRMSLGAMPRDILRMVVREGLSPAIVGALLGLLGAFGLARLVEKFLFGVKPVDVVTFGGATLILLAIAALACYFPARRATQVDPMEALRYE
jgi:macrolide transport system ATP-binding/permease protein